MSSSSARTTDRKPRLGWHETWLSVALVIANRSACDRAQVGAVIVDPTNRIIATGYNGPPAGFPHVGGCLSWCTRAQEASVTTSPRVQRAILDQSYSECPALHSEANALSVCDRRDRLGGTIYVTGHVCYGCAKLIANSGLHRVVVMTADAAEHRQPEASYKFLRDCGLDVTVDVLKEPIT